MPVTTPCPKCEKRYKTAAYKPGKKLRCKACKTVFVVEADEPQVDATLIEDSTPEQDDALNAEMGGKSALLGSGTVGGVTLRDIESGDSFFSDQTLDDAGDTAPDSPSGFQTVLSESEGESKYVVDTEIARGGMGAILRTIDRDIRREVAMKVMLRSADEKTRLRFVEEAQITGQLTHPNIVPVYDLGFDEDGQLYFTMKLVKGRSLEEVLDELREHPRTAESRFSLHKLLNVFNKVCDAIAFAHSKGVVHRDLKPANIMLGDYGEVLVMDWGLAKVGATRKARQSTRGGDVQDEAQAAADEEIADFVESVRTQSGTDLTLDGQVAGTPAYMSPEQAEGAIDKIDERSDIYALGAILYEMLCLKAPVQGKTVYEMLLAVAEGKVRPPQKRAGKHRTVPADLSAVALKALSKERDDRYQHVGDLKADVELFIEGRSVSARDAGVLDTLGKLVKRNKGVSAAVGVAGLVIVMIGVYSYSSIRAALVQSEIERVRAEDAGLLAKESLAKFRGEQIRRQEEGRKSAPAYLRLAKKSAEQGELEDAYLNANVALERAPDSLDVRLFIAALYVVRKEYDKGRSILRQYLDASMREIREGGVAALRKAMPQRRLARRLAGLCEEAKEKYTPNVQEKLYEALLDAGASELASQIAPSVGLLLEDYRRRIEKAWPGKGVNLALGHTNALSLRMAQRDDVVNLGPLKGMRLTQLSVEKCANLEDISALRGMKLRRVSLINCPKLKDISVMQGMPLEGFSCDGSGVSDLSPLEGMPLDRVGVGCTRVNSLMPLKGMTLTGLACGGTKVHDLSPLKGMPLVRLDLNKTRVSDLRPLQGMPLQRLSFWSAPVTDIEPLKGMPLTQLQMYGAGTDIGDLTPLAGMKLKLLLFRPETVRKGINVVREMETLEQIGVEYSQRWSPAEFWKKYDAGEFGPPVKE